MSERETIEALRQEVKANCELVLQLIAAQRKQTDISKMARECDEELLRKIQGLQRSFTVLFELVQEVCRLLFGTTATEELLSGRKMEQQGPVQ